MIRTAEEATTRVTLTIILRVLLLPTCITGIWLDVTAAIFGLTGFTAVHGLVEGLSKRMFRRRFNLPCPAASSRNFRSP